MADYTGKGSFGVVILAFVAASCQTPVPEITSGLDISSALRVGQPAEIVVLPLVDASKNQNFTAQLRAHARVEIANALIDRRYTSLAKGFVDTVVAREAVSIANSSVADAAYLVSVKGSWDEDAVLGIRVDRWDGSRLRDGGFLYFEAEVTMVDSGTGETLCSGQIAGTVKAGGAGAAPIAGSARVMDATTQFALAIIDQFPRRWPGKGKN
ncbi:MAG: hypothetical protein QF412_05325 [Planctomycetota bacterium]|jgi:hypothetical protein|nr:hypothetical protein [Planctomycetota bacterium]